MVGLLRNLLAAGRLVVRLYPVAAAGTKILSLIYSLWDRVEEQPAPADWPFSPLRKHWLYDEVDIAQDHRPLFWHRILFSDGTVLRIPFVSAIAHAVTLSDSTPKHG